jgi:chromosome condensin MukBEF MukE localization factor
MGDVLYIGSIDGTPLYATRSDIGDLMPDLEARLRASRDLDDVLDDEAFATRFATEIETFYTWSSRAIRLSSPPTRAAFSSR